MKTCFKEFANDKHTVRDKLSLVWRKMCSADRSLTHAKQAYTVRCANSSNYD